MQSIKNNLKNFLFFMTFAIVFTMIIIPVNSSANEMKSVEKKKLVYIVSDTEIPFWAIMGRGVSSRANSLGYEIEIFSSANNAKNELLATASAIKNKVAGIIISPNNSSGCVTVLKLAKSANIPVVISDIGTDGGEYVSFISSDNKSGAYEIGKILTQKMISLGWANGNVGIIAIPQKRLNGQMRTDGFMKALDEAVIKGAGLKQQVNFSEQETYDFSKLLIDSNPNIRAIFLQGSDKYRGALRAISDAGKVGKILLLTFDAEPEFIELISDGVMTASAMQQPYLMGQKAVEAMDNHLNGIKVEKNQQLEVLAISKENIMQKLTIIKRNVLGIEE